MARTTITNMVMYFFFPFILTGIVSLISGEDWDNIQFIDVDILSGFDGDDGNASYSAGENRLKRSLSVSSKEYAFIFELLGPIASSGESLSLLDLSDFSCTFEKTRSLNSSTCFSIILESWKHPNDQYLRYLGVQLGRRYYQEEKIYSLQGWFAEGSIGLGMGKLDHADGSPKQQLGVSFLDTGIGRRWVGSSGLISEIKMGWRYIDMSKDETEVTYAGSVFYGSFSIGFIY